MSGEQEKVQGARKKKASDKQWKITGGRRRNRRKEKWDRYEAVNEMLIELPQHIWIVVEGNCKYYARESRCQTVVKCHDRGTARKIKESKMTIREQVGVGN